MTKKGQGKTGHYPSRGIRIHPENWKNFRIWCIEHDTTTGKVLRKYIRSLIGLKAV